MHGFGLGRIGSTMPGDSLPPVTPVFTHRPSGRGDGERRLDDCTRRATPADDGPDVPPELARPECPGLAVQCPANRHDHGCTWTLRDEDPRVVPIQLDVVPLCVRSRSPREPAWHGTGARAVCRRLRRRWGARLGARPLRRGCCRLTPRCGARPGTRSLWRDLRRLTLSRRRGTDRRLCGRAGPPDLHPHVGEQQRRDEHSRHADQDPHTSLLAHERGPIGGERLDRAYGFESAQRDEEIDRVPGGSLEPARPALDRPGRAPGSPGRQRSALLNATRSSVANPDRHAQLDAQRHSERVRHPSEESSMPAWTADLPAYTCQAWKMAATRLPCARCPNRHRRAADEDPRDPQPRDPGSSGPSLCPVPGRSWLLHGSYAGARSRARRVRRSCTPSPSSRSTRATRTPVSYGGSTSSGIRSWGSSSGR